MKLNIRQKKVVEATEPKILCLSAAATGKTRTLTERIRYIIEKRNVNPKDIVAITFTNMASEEMKKRLGDIGEQCFIGTIHSYANKICLANKINTSEFLMTKHFDKIIEKAALLSSDKFFKVKHLLVDECQDLSPLEYSFLEKIPTENIFFVGDNRQAIYGFRSSTDEYLLNMYEDEEFKKYYLVEDYRNAPNIIKFADNFLASFRKISPPTIPVKTKDGEIYECSINEALDELELSQNWGSWFVLTRTNNELIEIQEMLTERHIPNVTFKKGDLDTLELDELMSSNRVKVLTIHSCMSGDTIVYTNKGITNIKEVVKNHDKNIKIFNGRYYDSVKSFIDNGVELTYKITTNKGHSIRLTENHDCIILEEGKLIKRKVKYLIGNEQLLFIKNPPSYITSKEDIGTAAPSILDIYDIERIKRIDAYKEEETYCLEMEHEHEFIQNGFLMGNSKGLENKNVIVTGARLYNEEERKIAYVAATRAENVLYWCPSFRRRTKKGNRFGPKGQAGRFFEKTNQEMIMFND